MTASGNIVLSWPDAEQFNAQTPPAQEMVDGAKGTITLDGKLAATIRIDKRSSQGSESAFTLTLSFRGLAAAPVDSSADHPSGQENDKAPGDIARTLMDGYESELIDKSNEKRRLKRFVISEGETVQQAIRRATREFGLVAYENEDGNLVLDSRESDEGEGEQLALGRDFT